jgi:hypothetical protein
MVKAFPFPFFPSLLPLSLLHLDNTLCVHLHLSLSLLGPILSTNWRLWNGRHAEACANAGQLRHPLFPPFPFSFLFSLPSLPSLSHSVRSFLLAYVVSALRLQRTRFWLELARSRSMTLTPSRYINNTTTASSLFPHLTPHIRFSLTPSRSSYIASGPWGQLFPARKRRGQAAGRRCGAAIGGA